MRKQVIDNTQSPIEIEGVPGETPPEQVPSYTRAQRLALNNSSPIVEQEAIAQQPNQVDPKTDLAKQGQLQSNISPFGSTEGRTAPQWDWGEILIGASPVLAGMLMGESDIGFSVGGQGLLDRQKELVSLEKERLKSLKSAGSKAQRGRYQTRAIEKNGKTVYKIFDTAEGAWLPEDESNELLAGYKQTVRVDPTTGELVMASGAGGLTSLRGTSPGPKTVKQEKDLELFQDKVLKDKKFSNARETISSTGRALALLQSNNPVADEGIKTIFPRMFGEVGNLAVQEQERFSGSPSITRKWLKLKTRWLDGTLSDDDRRDLIEVANVMGEYSKRNLYTAARSHIESFKKSKGYDPTEIIQPFLDESPSSAPAVVKKAKTKAPSYGKSPLMRQEVGNGQYHYFKLNARGSYDYVETK